MNNRKEELVQKKASTKPSDKMLTIETLNTSSSITDGTLHLSDHTNFLFCTDLEPDDHIALNMFVRKIDEKSENTFIALHICFLVGEGNSAVKYSTMLKLIQKFQNKGFMLNSNIKINIIEGYSDYKGSQAFFTKDGDGILTEEELSFASKTRGIESSEDKKNSRVKIIHFLEAHAKVLVLSLKPIHELLDIYNIDMLSKSVHPELFSKHTLACTGSYNFRSAFENLPIDEIFVAKKSITILLQLFERSFVYETFFTTFENSVTSNNAEELSMLIRDSKQNDLLYTYKIVANNWKKYLLTNLILKIINEKILQKLNDIELITAAEKSLFEQYMTPEYKINPIDDEKIKTEGGIRGQIKTLSESILSRAQKKSAPITDSQTTAVKNARTVSSTEKLASVLKVVASAWYNLTENVAMQMVISDPGLMAILSGECDEYFITDKSRLSIAPEGSFTIVTPPDTKEKGNVMVYKPKGADTVNLKMCQARLFKQLIKIITEETAKLIAKEIEYKSTLKNTNDTNHSLANSTGSKCITQTKVIPTDSTFSLNPCLIFSLCKPQVIAEPGSKLKANTRDQFYHSFRSNPVYNH